MSRFALLAGGALVAATLALPTIPAVAAPSDVVDCLTVIGDENIVDVAICAALVTLPPEVSGLVTPYLLPVLRDPLGRCATAHIAACDYVVCPLFTQLPDVPGVLDVRPDGDLYVADQFVWDCPPYEVT
jgi:hypothetical protein